MGQPTALIAQAKKMGVQDAYGFAEWLVWDMGFFGKFPSPDMATEDEMSDIESCYIQAQAWWQGN